MTGSRAEVPWRALALPALPPDVLVRLFGLDGALEIVPPTERTQDELARLLSGVDVVDGVDALVVRWRGGG